MTYKAINRLVNVFIGVVIVVGVLFAIYDVARGVVLDAARERSREEDPKLQMRIDQADMEFQPW